MRRRFVIPDEVVEKHGSLSSTDLRRAMVALDASLDDMATSLGVSRRLVSSLRNDQPIPNHIALAVRYLVVLHLQQEAAQAAFDTIHPTGVVKRPPKATKGPELR